MSHPSIYALPARTVIVPPEWMDRFRAAILEDELLNSRKSRFQPDSWLARQRAFDEFEAAILTGMIVVEDYG